MSWVNAIVQGILVGGLFALFACGLSLLFGTMKVINLAHGDLAVVAAFLAVELAPVTHIPVVWSFLLVVPIFVVLGYVGQRTLIQASLDRGPLTTLLVTFGLSVVIENVLLQAFSADSHSLNIGSLATRSIHITDQIQVAYVSIAIFVIAVVVLLGLQYFLSRTRTGRMIRAVADDPEAAQLVGIDFRHIFGIAASIAFATVALAGLAFGTYSSFGPSTGGSRLLFAFEAVVIGGLGSLWGTLLGGIILGVAQAIGAHIDPSLQVLSGHLVFLVAARGPPGRAHEGPGRGMSSTSDGSEPVPAARVARSRAPMRWTALSSVVVVGVLAYLPYAVYSGTTDTLVNLFILLTLASMWNLLAGYAGLVSVGQQAFIGLGAYIVLFLALHGISPFVAIPIAAIGCARRWRSRSPRWSSASAAATSRSRPGSWPTHAS